MHASCDFKKASECSFHSRRMFSLFLDHFFSLVGALNGDAPLELVLSGAPLLDFRKTPTIKCFPPAICAVFSSSILHQVSLVPPISNPK